MNDPTPQISERSRFFRQQYPQIAVLNDWLQAARGSVPLNSAEQTGAHLVQNSAPLPAPAVFGDLQDGEIIGEARQ